MLALSAREVSYLYGEQVALRQVTLDIAAGDFFALLGPNGAGKSTLLRLLALLEQPGGGEILVNDNIPSPSSLLKLRRQMALVFQNPLLFQTTVWSNITYGLKVRHLPKREISERAEWAINLVGLGGFESRNAGQLSAGESQLVNLARAFALRPQVLLLDEPTVDLDLHNAVKVEQVIQDYRRHLQPTVVLVTHNLFQARRLASNAGFLHEGRLVETGPCQELLKNPRDERTAAFVSGEMAF